MNIAPLITVYLSTFSCVARHCEPYTISSLRAIGEAIQTASYFYPGLLRRFAPRNDEENASHHAMTTVTRLYKPYTISSLRVVHYFVIASRRRSNPDRTLLLPWIASSFCSSQ